MLNLKEPDSKAKKLVEFPQTNDVESLTFNPTESQNLTENEKKLVESSNQNQQNETSYGNKEQHQNKSIYADGDYQSSMQPDHNRQCMNIITNQKNYYNVCDLIMVKKILTPLDSSSERQIVLETVNSSGKTKEVHIPFQSITTREGVYNELSKEGFTLSSCNFATHLSNYVSVEVRKIQNLQQDEYVINGIGWTKTPDNQLAFVLDDTYGTTTKIKSLKDLTFKKGDKEAYYKFVNDVICPSYSLQLAFTLGLTSIITSLLKEQTGINVIMVDLAGGSSTGKSTAQMLAVSPFGNPKICNTGLFRTFNGTYNSFIAGNNGFHGVPIVMDDATAQDAANWEKLVYEMVAGENKARCDSSGHLQSKMDNWDGSVIISSEYAIFDNTSTKLGAQARLLVAENIQWTKSADEAVKIKQFVLNNYGHIAPDFVEKLICTINQKGMDYLVNAYHKVNNIILNKITKKDNLTERICNQISLISLTALLIKKLLRFNFDANKIVEPFIEREIKSISKRNIYDNAMDAVLEFITKNNRCFFYKGQPKPSHCIGCIRPSSSNKVISILEDELDNYLASKHIVGTTKIFHHWVEKGILQTEEGRLTKKDHYLGKSRAYFFQFDKDDVCNVEYLAQIHNVPPDKIPENNVDFLLSQQEKELKNTSDVMHNEKIDDVVEGEGNE